MGFSINLKANYTNCPYGCKLFNDNNDYSYWEDKKETQDEREILSFINNSFKDGQKILHVGIGNSYIAKNLSQKNYITGITISKNEINTAKNLNLINYNFFFQNKYAENNILDKITNLYDIIIDINLKSYSCCNNSFQTLFHRYKKNLTKKGIIVTSFTGMKWSRLIKPVLSFSLKNLLYKRLKEFDGPKKNLLTFNECENLSNKFNLKVIKINESILIFKNQI